MERRSRKSSLSRLIIIIFSSSCLILKCFAQVQVQVQTANTQNTVMQVQNPQNINTNQNPGISVNSRQIQSQSQPISYVSPIPGASSSSSGNTGYASNFANYVPSASSSLSLSASSVSSAPTGAGAGTGEDEAGMSYHEQDYYSYSQPQYHSEQPVINPQSHSSYSYAYPQSYPLPSQQVSYSTSDVPGADQTQNRINISKKLVFQSPLEIVTTILLQLTFSLIVFYSLLHPREVDIPEDEVHSSADGPSSSYPFPYFQNPVSRHPNVVKYDGQTYYKSEKILKRGRFQSEKKSKKNNNNHNNHGNHNNRNKMAKKTGETKKSGNECAQRVMCELTLGNRIARDRGNQEVLNGLCSKYSCDLASGIFA